MQYLTTLYQNFHPNHVHFMSNLIGQENFCFYQQPLSHFMSNLISNLIGQGNFCFYQQPLSHFMSNLISNLIDQGNFCFYQHL
jgi:hypothetical protein